MVSLLYTTYASFRNRIFPLRYRLYICHERTSNRQFMFHGHGSMKPQDDHIIGTGAIAADSPRKLTNDVDDLWGSLAV